MRRIRITTALLVPLAAAIAASPAAAAKTTVDYDLDGSPPPVPASLNRLDLYTPPGASPSDRRPVVVYIHGGAWRTGDKGNAIADKVALFTGAGYVFASVNYRLSPDPVDPAFPADRVRFPDHPDDVGEAIGWLDRNVSSYGGDRKRIVLIGHSAGAQLASLVATDPRYVTRWGVASRDLLGFVSLDGEYDIIARLTPGTARSRALFYNAFATPAENAVDGAWEAGSPIRWAGPVDPPSLLVTQQGSASRRAHSEAMAAALGPDSSVLAVPYDHGGINAAVGSADDPAGETPAIMTFIRGAIAASRASAVRITARPPNRVRLGQRRRVRVRFRFAARDAASAFECRLDAGVYRRCDSPRRYKLPGGRHVFRVRAISSNGARGPVEADRFRVVGAR